MDGSTLLLVVFPILILIYSIVGTWQSKKFYIMPLFTIFIFSVITIIIDNPSFSRWVLIYTFFSLIISLIVWFFRRKA